MAKLKIIGDGTPQGTQIWVGDVRLEGVQTCEVTMGVHQRAVATLVVKRPDLHLEGEFETLHLVGEDPDAGPK
jgi:hypothetical protein